MSNELAARITRISVRAGLASDALQKAVQHAPKGSANGGQFVGNGGGKKTGVAAEMVVGAHNNGAITSAGKALAHAEAAGKHTNTASLAFNATMVATHGRQKGPNQRGADEQKHLHTMAANLHTMAAAHASAAGEKTLANHHSKAARFHRNANRDAVAD
jgi:hypothetical protein